jgi:hypothetical protein
MTWIGEDAMIFRLSQKLNAKVKAGALGTLPLHENPFADWSAHLFVAGRTQYLLLRNTKSLYSTVSEGLVRRVQVERLKEATKVERQRVEAPKADRPILRRPGVRRVKATRLGHRL